MGTAFRSRWSWSAWILAPVAVLLLLREGSMNETGVLGVEALIQAARAQPAKSFPLETFQSYPIPVRSNGALLVRFLYGPQQARPRMVDLTVPTHVAEIDGRSGRLIGIRRFRPADFGLQDSPGSPLGTDTLPPGVSTEEYLAQRVRLLRAYDILLPAYSSGGVPDSEEVRKAAVEFRLLFPLVAERPMLPIYRAVAADFFTWIGSLAG
jgi:hypothetical protein